MSGAPLRDAEVAVVEERVVGAAIAWRLARRGAEVAVLDEGDAAFRASRGNFALVWVQSKGLGMPEYAGWIRASAERWPELAAALRDETGIDVAHRRPGGFTLCLSDAELQACADPTQRLHNQPEMTKYHYEVLDHAGTKPRLPAVGPDVAGSIYCPPDGHVNSLRLFHALHAAIAGHRVSHRPNHPVHAIAPEAGGFRITGPWGALRSEKIVLAAGLGNARLAPMVELEAPVKPSKGQIIATEKVAPFLDHPVVTMRQTDEGGVMIGESQEDTGFGTVVRTPVISVMAERAIRMFPRLAGANVVRTCSALRVMSPDGFPTYDRAADHPGAYLATCHSGVTLAANHALALAPAILDGALPGELQPCSAWRLHVPPAA